MSSHFRSTNLSLWQQIRGFLLSAPFIIGACVLIPLFITAIAAWITHVVICLLDERYILLLVGALLAPIGIIHGVLIWLGFAL